MNIDVDDILPVLDLSELDEDIQDVIEAAPIEEPQEEIKDTKEDIFNEPKPVEQESNDDLRTSTAFYNELVKRGIAIESDKEEYSWDEVENTINSYSEDLPTRVANTLVESVPEIGRNLMNFLFAKQDSLTKEDLESFYKDHLSNVSLPQEFSSDDEARQYLKGQYKGKFRDSQIEAMLDALEDEDALQEEAKKLVDQSKGQKQEELIKERERKLSSQKQFISKLNKEFEDLNWNKQRVNKVKEIISTGSGNEILGQVVNNPQGLIQLMNFLSYWKDDKFDLSDFGKIQTSKQSKSLKDAITEEMMTSASMSTRSKNKSQGGFDLSNLKPII